MQLPEESRQKLWVWNSSFEPLQISRYCTHCFAPFDETFDEGGSSVGRPKAPSLSSPVRGVTGLVLLDRRDPQVICGAFLFSRNGRATAL